MMKAMYRNCLGVLLAAVLTMCGLVPASAQNTHPDDEIWYTSSNDEIIEPYNTSSISSNTYQNGMGVIKFQTSITEVHESLFVQCEELTSVILPNSVTTIKPSAFLGCTNLTSITLSDNLASIGSHAFNSCTNLTSITLPNSVESIGNFAFSGCSRLTSITLPDKVKNIGDGVFSNCTYLQSLTIGNSVSEIGEQAFFMCNRLRAIYVYRTTPPALGTGAFSDVNTSGNNASVYVPETETDDYAGWGGLTDIVGLSITEYEELANMTISNARDNVRLTAADEDKVNTYVSQINAITEMSDASLAAILDAQTAALAVIGFQKAKDSAIAELQNYISSNVSGVNIDPYIDRIRNAVSEGIIASVVIEAKAAIDKQIENARRFTLGGTTCLLSERNDEYYIDELKFDDGLDYQSEFTFEVENLKYARNLSPSNGTWQCWYVPFDMTLESYVLEKIDAAEVAGILLDGEGKTIVAFRKMDEGEIMKANTPYVIRQKDTRTGFLELNLGHVTLYPSQETTFTMQSAYDDFEIGGNYQARKNNGYWYTLNTSGDFQLMKSGLTLKAQRFWLTFEERSDGPYYHGEADAPIRDSIDMMVLGDEYGPTEVRGMQYVPSADGIYNLQGQRVTTIESGRMYIVNGKKYIAE